MLGLFDSGSGGLNTVRYIKKMAPDLDMVYKIDRENSPYGIKKSKDLIRIIESNIDDLTERGADKVLIACCTASTLYTRLSKRHRDVSIPIISPIVLAAQSATKNQKIGVIATQGTVRSHAFAKSLPMCSVFEIAAQELVGLIDNGLNDKTATEKDDDMLKRIIMPLVSKNTDTIILGCTHFPALYQSFVRVCHPLGIKNIIDSAKIGAMALINEREQNERKKQWQTTEEEE